MTTELTKRMREILDREIAMYEWRYEQQAEVISPAQRKINATIAAMIAARNEALEEVARAADEAENVWAQQWRKGHKSDSHLEGMSDGAGDVAAAIRALKDKP